MLNEIFRRDVSLSVTYKRGAASVSLQATIGSSKGWTEKEDGIREQWVSRDFLVAAADLILDGQRIEPMRGDQIIEVSLDEDGEPLDTITYKVLPPVDKEPCFTISDHSRLRYRVHAKEISKVAV